ncbi:MAG: hypothetical protein PHP44_15560 [Kiritimatiellae bacterium]|nr:hypothetical protein [Kiritimatiellia bacterium]MDD4737515.1 hypothetical protein [Kiritimatiellia bacterium]
MKSTTYLLLAGMALAATARAGLDVNTGSLLMRGGKIQSDAFQITSGSLCGNGVIESTTILLNGVTAPSGEYEAETGTLQFNGDVELNGFYHCKANANSDLDLLQATGAFSGNARVKVFTNLNAVPLSQTIIAASADSDYSSLGLFAPQASAFQLAEDAAGNLRLTDLTGDTDGNGIPDWWENHYFGGRTNCVPGGDSDGDLADNANEYGAGTDPTNAASCFAIAGFTVSSVGSDTVIRWSSVTGKTYAIERSTNLLAAASFVPVFTNIAATPPNNTWTNPASSSAALYYRIVVEP